MKRYFILFLALSLILVLSSCAPMYDADDLEQAKEEAYNAGYEDGRTAGFEEAVEEVEHCAITDLENLDIDGAHDYASDIELYFDEPEEHTETEFNTAVSHLIDFVTRVSNLHRDWEESGIW